MHRFILYVLEYNFTFIDRISLNWKRYICEWWNKKSMKPYKSLGGRIAHLEVPTSRKFLNPPNKLKSKKRECQTKQFIITRLSMRGFFDWWKYVSVWSISHFGLFSFLVLYLSWNSFLQSIFLSFDHFSCVLIEF